MQKQLVPFAEYAEALYPNVIAMPAILGFGLVYPDKISSIFLHSKCMNKSCNKGEHPKRKYYAREMWCCSKTTLHSSLPKGFDQSNMPP